ncbi:MAG: tetratricopeptide repeat protein [Verrucomicrobiota bacterium]
MPPWPPSRGRTSFLGERILTDSQIALLSEWVTNGAPEGNTGDLPKSPKFDTKWQLGKPDLVLTTSEPFTVPADGPDIYRNFVIRVPNTVRRWIKAVEILPEPQSVVHHAFILLDKTGEARRLDEREPGPGFSGMNPGTNSTMPQGYFATWHPGSTTREATPGISWALNPNTDIVLQMHIRPRGKPENLRASIGLYFTDKPPTKFPFCLLLRSTSLDIPAGDPAYMTESSYQLPCDVWVHSCLPHAHYLAKDVHGWAELPNGSSQDILHIPAWNFDWQNDYVLREPFLLPKGSTLRMRYTFDNSSANIRNPSTPPKRVLYGPQSDDEMAELWLQLIPSKPENFSVLQNDYFSTYGLKDVISTNKALLARDPNSTAAHVQLSTALAASNRFEEALFQLRKAAEIDPTTPQAFRIMGQIYMRQQKAEAARTAFEKALQTDPKDPIAHSELGWTLVFLGQLPDGISHLETALVIDPTDEKTRAHLQQARALENKTKR